MTRRRQWRGRRAHEHVRRCDAKPLGADQYYATDEQYERAWQLRRQKLLQNYFLDNVLDKDLQAKVWKELEQELRDLGLATDASGAVVLVNDKVNANQPQWLGPNG